MPVTTLHRKVQRLWAPGFFREATTFERGSWGVNLAQPGRNSTQPSREVWAVISGKPDTDSWRQARTDWTGGARTGDAPPSSSPGPVYVMQAVCDGREFSGVWSTNLRIVRYKISIAK